MWAAVDAAWRAPWPCESVAAISARLGPSIPAIYARHRGAARAKNPALLSPALTDLSVAYGTVASAGAIYRATVAEAPMAVAVQVATAPAPTEDVLDTPADSFRRRCKNPDCGKPIRARNGQRHDECWDCRSGHSTVPPAAMRAEPEPAAPPAQDAANSSASGGHWKPGDRQCRHCYARTQTNPCNVCGGISYAVKEAA